MPLFRTPLLIWLFGVSALMFIIAAPAPAQVGRNKNSAEEEKKPPVSWPPKNAQKHEIKRANQSQGLVLYTPGTWKMDDSESETRLAEFSVSAEPPMTLRVFSFENEKAGGGGVQANITRWTDQFQQLKKKKIWTGVPREEKMQNRLYVLVDLEGTYKRAGGQPLQDARMLAAIIGLRWNEVQMVEGEKQTVQKSAVYFLEMVGPEKAVTANEKHFRHAFGAVDQENELTDNEESEETSSN